MPVIENVHRMNEQPEEKNVSIACDSRESEMSFVFGVCECAHKRDRVYNVCLCVCAEAVYYSIQPLLHPFTSPKMMRLHQS